MIDTPKRILIFSLAYFPHVGGAEVALKEVTDRIDPNEIEFHMITMRFSRAEKSEEKIGNVFVHRIGNNNGRLSKLLFQYMAAHKAATLHAEQAFDAAWAMMAHSAGIPAAHFHTFHPEVPYVLSLQEGDPIAHIERTMLPLWPLFTQAFTKAKIILPLSNYLADWARARHFKGPIQIIPNGADVEHFSKPATSDRLDRIRKEIGKPAGSVALVSTSRLVHKNALDDVIRSLALLPEHIHFFNFGFGPDGDSLRSLARQQNVADRVHLLPHPGLPMLPDYLHATDIFIRPSRTEGFGVSFMEAMAAGLPVIATQEGGIADFLFDEKRNPDYPTTGFAVDTDSPEHIAQTVTYILSNPEKVRRVKENALAMVKEKYEWNLIARDMKRVFDRVIEGR